MSYEELFSAYKLLDCTPDMSFEEIKKKFKKLAKENHPDLVEDKELATKKMSALNAAFDLIEESFKLNIKLDDLKKEEDINNYSNNYTSKKTSDKEYKRRRETFRKAYKVYEYFKNRRDRNNARYRSIKSKVRKIENYIKENGDNLQIEKYIEEIYKALEERKVGKPISFSSIEIKIAKLEKIIRRREENKQYNHKEFVNDMNTLIWKINDLEKSKLQAREQNWNSIPVDEMEKMNLLVIELNEAIEEVKDVYNFQSEVFSGYGPKISKVLDDEMRANEDRYNYCIKQFSTAIDFYSTRRLLETAKNYFEEVVKLGKSFDPYEKYFFEKLETKYQYIEEELKKNRMKLGEVAYEDYSKKYFMESSFVKDLIEEKAPIDFIIWNLSYNEGNNKEISDYNEIYLKREMLYESDLSCINKREQVKLANALDDLFVLDIENMSYNNVGFKSTVNYLDKYGINLSSSNPSDDLEYERLSNKMDSIQSDVGERIATDILVSARDNRDKNITPEYLKDIAKKIDFIFEKIGKMIDLKAPVSGIDWYLDLCSDKNIDWYLEKYNKLTEVKDEKEEIIDEIEIPDFMNRDVRHGR